MEIGLCLYGDRRDQEKVTDCDDKGYLIAELVVRADYADVTKFTAIKALNYICKIKFAFSKPGSDGLVIFDR